VAFDTTKRDEYQSTESSQRAGELVATNQTNNNNKRESKRGTKNSRTVAQLSNATAAKQ